MRENDLFSNEFPQRPEHDIAPEHSMLPEYNPVYPDITFFKESSVTCREENIFQGRPPEGEPDLRSRREERKKRSKYSILQKFLGSAIRGGAAVLCAALVVAVITSDGDDGRGAYASKIADAVNSSKRPAFTQQTGYGADEFARLWDGDPNAPHKYDIEDPSAVKEPTCTEAGEADYVCTACGIHVHYAIPAKGHTAGDPVIQNETAATCTEEGSYEEIINCAVCGEELSRRTVAVAATGHTAGEPERENEAAATCTEGGSYEEVVYCSVCGEEISREPVISEALGHNAAAPEKENEKAATCTEGGSYEEVIYCSRCGEEISRNTVRTAALGHTAAAAVREKETAATCTEGGHYDNVVYCSVCGEEMSRSTVNSAALGHSASAAVTENGSEATCTESGHYDSVVYCSTCGEELSRTEVTEPAKGHQAAAPVKENEVAATCETEGSYDNVVYCSVCNKEMTRTTIKVAALGHDWGPVTYTWASDNSTVTAAKPCRNDSSHNITETVRAASEVITEPDCETTGTTRYTAAFSNSAFTSQTKNVTVAALGHDYETIYEWNYEDGICYAYAYCMRHPNDSSHNVEETSTATRTVTKEATCVDNGSCTLTASFSSSAFSTQTVEDEIPATGVHHYVSTQMIESKTCEHTQYYYLDVCDMCGEADPNATPSEAIWEEGPGHDYPSSPPNGVAMCSVCGDLIVNANYYNNAVYYSINETYVYETMAEAGYTYEGDARLYSYTTGGYLNETGYNWDEYTREIPEEYRNTGERFRIDIFFTNGSYISSNDTTYYD